MSGPARFDEDALHEAAMSGLRDVADRIAGRARRRAKDHDYADSIRVADVEAGVRVYSDHPFAHLDEYGSINNPPTAAMRSAAVEEGNYSPTPKR